MSRSGYSDDVDDNWALIRWRGAVASALRGRRGQEFLRELLAALDAMPHKVLITEELQAEGSFCTMGVVGDARGLDMGSIDAYDTEQVSAALGIPYSIVKEIAYLNDEGEYWERETPQQRWIRMRKWVANQITCYDEATA